MNKLRLITLYNLFTDFNYFTYMKDSKYIEYGKRRFISISETGHQQAQSENGRIKMVCQHNIIYTISDRKFRIPVVISP